jgi:hypothetical protein
MSTKENAAKAIVARIIEDLTERHGLGDEWDLLSEDVQDDIREAWLHIVRSEMAGPRPKRSFAE